MFRLTKDEVIENLRSQNVTLDVGAYSKYPPNVFTEQGIYMLMTVLKGSDAVEQSKALIRLFKRMEDYITLAGSLSGTQELCSVAVHGRFPPLYLEYTLMQCVVLSLCL